jgi:hypothetical protein
MFLAKVFGSKIQNPLGPKRRGVAIFSESLFDYLRRIAGRPGPRAGRGGGGGPLSSELAALPWRNTRLERI